VGFLVAQEAVGETKPNPEVITSKTNNCNSTGGGSSSCEEHQSYE